jgi:DnaK suppressor protein
VKAAIMMFRVVLETSRRPSWVEVRECRDWAEQFDGTADPARCWHVERVSNRRWSPASARRGGRPTGAERRDCTPIDQGGPVDTERARALLSDERTRIEGLLRELGTDRSDDRDAADERTDWSDLAQPLTSEGTDDAIAETLRERLHAVGRAEERLKDGTYGRSVRSGAVIPDERLLADPTAELTVEEAAADV